jgi:ATP-dependent exoDNAse (exonuclease V) beta subunit
MLAKREQWLPHTIHQRALSLDEIAEHCAQILQSYIKDKLKVACQVLPTHIQMMLMPLVRYAANNLEENHALKRLQDWQLPLSDSPNNLNDWLLLIDLLLTDKGNFRKKLTVENGFPPDKSGERDRHIETFYKVCELIEDTSALNALRDLPLVNTNEIFQNSKIVYAFSQVLQLAAANLWQVFQISGEVDFVAISRMAINALNNEDAITDLSLKLDYQISHLLVDEFQDTNATQKELLENLTAGWQVNDHRTLFCVGDPMQSIYRFRKADVSLFLEAANIGIGNIVLQPLKLSRNNRSRPQVVEWINEKFAQILPFQDNTLEAAISYRKFIPTLDNIDDEGVEIHPLVLQLDEDKPVANAYEASYTAALIDQEQTKYPHQKIAVLVRSRAHLHELVSEIRRNFKHLKFQAVEIEGLQDRQTVQDALSLTRAMLHRADRVHWLNVLRAPWCGLTLTDLHALCSHNHQATIWKLMQSAELSLDGQVRLTHVKNILTQAIDQQGRMPLRRWLESTWLQLGGGNTLISPGDNRDIQAFFDLVENLAQGYELDFIQLESAMKKLYAEPDITENDHLQFLTIHKSKGLEFDCVILPALNRKPRHPDSPLMLWEEVKNVGQARLLAAPYVRKSKGSPSIYDYIKQLETTRSNHETARLLYVAATRSIRKLHLVGTVKRKDAKILPVKDSLLELLWDSVKNHFMDVDTIPISSENSMTLAQFTPQLMRLSNVQMPAIFSENQYVEPSFNERASQKPDEPNISQKLAADKGTLAHLYMEIIAKTGVAHWSEGRLDGCLQAMYHWLNQQGYDKTTCEVASTDVLRILKSTLSSEDGQWVLQTRHEAASELVIESFSNVDIEMKIIDRTFIENGVRWIIDYKSLELSNNGNLQFTAEQYREQLEAYAQLFANEGLPIQTAILFLSLGKLIKVNTSLRLN